MALLNRKLDEEELYMTTKDWILLLTPIVINGGILYFIQMLISEKIKRNDSKKVLIKGIYEKYLVMIDEALQSYRETLFVLLNAREQEEQELVKFNMSIGQLRKDIRDLQFYYVDYKCVLGEDKKLAEMYERLNQEFIEFNSGEVKNAITFLRQGEFLLQQILERTLKIMLNS